MASQRKRLVIFVPAFVGILLSASTAFSSGYQLNEHGASAIAMGGAFVARAWDPSAIYFNPAGLSYVKGFDVMLGGTLIMPSTTFTDVNDTQWKASSSSFFPPNAYLTYNFDNGLAAGIGVFTPEGLGTNWPMNWLGDYIIKKISLQSFDINPTISYSFFNNMISVGAGFDYALGSVTLEREGGTQFSDSLGNPVPFVHMDGNAKGTGFNFGIMLKPYENVSLGFSYRSKITFKVDNGTAAFSNAGSLADSLPGGKVSTSLPFPTTWYAGIAYKGDNFSVEADYQYVGWSAYDSLSIDFQTQTSAQKNTSIQGRYSNTYIVRVGGEYNLSEMWTLRAGVFYDKNPVPDAYEAPILPDADRLGLNIGIGVNVTNNVSVDASYMFLPFKQRTITNSAFGLDGTYNTTANLFGIDISYKL